MRFVTFSDKNGERVGVLEGTDVIDISAHSKDIPTSMLELIGYTSVAGFDSIGIAVKSAPRIAVLNITICAPIPKPAKNIFCVGKNYHEHAKEFHKSGFDASAGANAIPDAPIIFSKPATTVIGPNVAIQGNLDPTASVDYENELAVIIGKGGRSIPAGKAYEHVFGYTIVNDVTARTLQHKHKQWFLGKGIDTFCPMGPAIVTRDEIADVNSMRLITKVNGEVRQDALVKDLIFDIPTLIECISRSITLEPGDIIATGTPAGVGIGFSPPKFLVAGDVVSTAIEPIGELVNPIE